MMRYRFFWMGLTSRDGKLRPSFDEVITGALLVRYAGTNVTLSKGIGDGCGIEVGKGGKKSP